MIHLLSFLLDGIRIAAVTERAIRIVDERSEDDAMGGDQYNPSDHGSAS